MKQDDILRTLRTKGSIEIDRNDKVGLDAINWLRRTNKISKGEIVSNDKKTGYKIRFYLIGD